MAFSDPQSITVDADTMSLPRIGFGLNNGQFQTADGLLKLTVSHAYNKRTRRVVRLDVKKTAADPLYPDTNKVRTLSAYLVVDTEPEGFSVAEQREFVEGLTGFLTASSSAALTKVLGGES